MSNQWSHPVRFREAVEAMHRDGVRIFVEVGPRGSLSAFVDDTLRGRHHLAVPANVVDRTGVAQLAHLLARLAAQHVPMNLRSWYAHRSPRRLRTPEGWLPRPEVDKGSVRLNVELPVLRLDGPPGRAGGPGRCAGAGACPTASARRRCRSPPVSRPRPVLGSRRWRPTSAR